MWEIKEKFAIIQDGKVIHRVDTRGSAINWIGSNYVVNGTFEIREEIIKEKL